MRNSHFFHLAAAFRFTPSVRVLPGLCSHEGEGGESTAAPAATHNLQKTSRSTSDVKDMLEKRTLVFDRRTDRSINFSWDEK